MSCVREGSVFESWNKDIFVRRNEEKSKAFNSYTGIQDWTRNWKTAILFVISLSESIFVEQALDKVLTFYLSVTSLTIFFFLVYSKHYV